MFFKNKIIAFVFIIFISVTLSSCTRAIGDTEYKNNQEVVQPKSEYLSITVTQYDDGNGPENGMSIKFIKYDIIQKKLLQLMKTNYTSQYPLGTISMRDQKIYYTAESGTDPGSDELYSYDMLTKKRKQLTDELFAINQIIPRENDVIIVGVKRGTSAIRLIRYGKESNKLFYDHLEDDDTCVEFASLNTNDNNQIYTSTYSDKSRRESSEKQAQGDADHYIIPNYTISNCDNDISNPIQMEVIQNRIVRSVSGNGKYLVTKEVDSLELDTYKLFIEDLNSNIKTTLEIKEVAKCKDLQIDKSGKKIYFIGILEHSDERAIFCYDTELKLLDKIFVPKKGIEFINNFTLVCE